MNHLERETVVRVRNALTTAGFEDTVVELAATARSAEDAAASVGCEQGAIVKSLVFAIDDRLVMALVAGDCRCLDQNLPAAFNLKGSVRRPQASEVKGATGFSIGGIPPVGLRHPLPVVIDRSLKRFDKLYAAAGHPHCVFATTIDDLKRLTGGIVSWNIAEADGKNVELLPIPRSKTFLEQAADEKNDPNINEPA
jgi:prolyl-tRNA editing enzyme YbaK/EbsC (Cys-tRNA(Pro) deacylase)